MPDAPTVPPGWTAHLDVAANRYYYVETATGKTQWDPPEGTIMPPPKEVKKEEKKEEKKPDYMKMAKDYHKKSSNSAFCKSHVPEPQLHSLFSLCHSRLPSLPSFPSFHIPFLYLFNHMTNIALSPHETESKSKSHGQGEHGEEHEHEEEAESDGS